MKPKQDVAPLIKWLADNDRPQTWLAKQLKCPKGNSVNRITVWSWIHGKYKITDFYLTQIEEITGIEADEINPQTKGSK